MPDYWNLPIRRDLEQAARQLQTQQEIASFREELWRIIDECRERLGLPDRSPEPEPTIH